MYNDIEASSHTLFFRGVSMCTWCDTICHTVDIYRSPDQGFCTCFQDTSTSATSVEVAMRPSLHFVVALKQEKILLSYHLSIVIHPKIFFYILDGVCCATVS